MDVTPPSLSRQGTAESAPQGTGLLNIAGEKIGAAALWDIRFFYAMRAQRRCARYPPSGEGALFMCPLCEENNNKKPFCEEAIGFLFLNHIGLS